MPPKRLTLNFGNTIQSLSGTYRERYHQAYNFDPRRVATGRTLHIWWMTSMATTLVDSGEPCMVGVIPFINGMVHCWPEQEVR